MKSLVCAGLVISTLCFMSPARAQLAPGSMDVQWSTATTHCETKAPPSLQVHRYNATTFVLRESLCETVEAPFMYLLVGTDKALLIDTGDVAESQRVPLGNTVMSLLPQANGSTLPLIVVHTHGHLDHRTGDSQFAQQPNTQVVGTDLDHVKQFFGFTDWPNGAAQLDLGGRVVDVLPTPGHYASHVLYYDRQTGLVFSGDFLLPGRLLIEDRAADLASAHRVADFFKDRPVSYVLGGHIELDKNGALSGLGTAYHPDERALPMSKQDLLDLPAIVADFNGFYSTHGMFVMMNQNRVLLALLVGALAVLAGIGYGVYRFFRRHKAKRRAAATAMA
ncbi:Glyoxylase, beta-lactamase superfamily II [Dyella sp. OK004]|uniref:MBL fold metallo-hydrolase n=1 Tax=Dyella sp. OK004 TaxID=1855292 RepID=UPI0008F16D92|nr:MBL fold metallo-hydrolase [Dyella sp. OK004]SFR93642.1 Glyoxylase, beta-lactamase superfamily II [Dyella sp. OK004]